MKTTLLTIAAILISASAQIQAQFCGPSGNTICSPSGTLTEAGFTPSEDIPCITRGVQTDFVIQFKSYDTVRFANTLLSINEVKIDSIQGLPSGLCWRSNKSDNSFMKLEEGCIKISGLTNAPAGQYKLKMNMLVDIDGIGDAIPYDADNLGLTLYLRVINSTTSLCPMIDTTQTNPFDPGVNLDSVAIVSGKAYIDANQNSSYDIGETVLKNVAVAVGNTFAITNSLGNYRAYVTIGSHTLTPALPSDNAYTYAALTQTVNVTALGVEYANNDFAASVTPGYCNGSLSVVNIAMPPRPGFDHTIGINFTNSLSESAVSQRIRLSYSTPQRFVSASATPITVDTVARFIEWQISGLASGASWAETAEFILPVSTELGSVINYEASINNSTCNRLDSLTHAQDLVVVGSYDPNDKAVSPVGYSDHHGVNPDLNKEFTYKIRFQNTGTFFAENIVVIDTISQHLNLSTLKVLNASHSYEVTVEDNRAVKFWFRQIMLADSFNNEPESHGYIQYSIKPYTGLAQNVQITNRADIYFDFNAPVLTNTTYTTVDYNDYNVGITEANEVSGFALLPNPSSGLVQLIADAALIGKQVSVMDISGKVLLQSTIEQLNNSLDLSHLAKGMYMIKAGSRTEKLLLK